ncbi:MAG TPA: FtsX-like permease family protein, partial [Bacteroidia bacterium]|nr:FtsX-like permease family protein [Bacteroidia bacterium]
LTFFVARRYLFSRKSHNAINIVTGISVACVAVVTASLIIILSAMNGLSDLVETLYNSFHADVRITPAKGKVFIPDSMKVEELKKIPGVAWYTEIVDENALVENSDRQLIVTMRGVEDDYHEFTHFDSVVKQGRFSLHPQGRIGAVVGQEIAARMDLVELSQLNLYVPKRDRNLVVDLSNMDDEPFNKEVAYVSGLYSVSSDFDGKYVILPIKNVRELMDYTKECSSVEMGVSPGADKDEVLQKIKSVMGPQFLVQNRYQQNEVLFSTLKSEKMWTFLILLFILFIATFNTIGSLTLLIIEKKKDIGILWSMGSDLPSIRRIFFTEGLLISFTGTIAGMIIGLTLCFLQKQFGLIHLSEGFVVDAYPVAVKWMDVLLIGAAVTAIGLLAAWFPVRVYTKKYQSVKFSG